MSILIEMFRCPSRSWTTLIGTPALSARVADVCLSPWNLILRTLTRKPAQAHGTPEPAASALLSGLVKALAIGLRLCGQALLFSELNSASASKRARLHGPAWPVGPLRAGARRPVADFVRVQPVARCCYIRKRIATSVLAAISHFPSPRPLDRNVRQ